MRGLILVRSVNNLWIDIQMYWYKLKILSGQYKLIGKQDASAIEHLSYDLILMLYSYISGKRKYTKEYIIEYIMNFQTSIIDSTGNALDYYTVNSYNTFHSQFILKNDLYQMIMSDRYYMDQVQDIMNTLYIGMVNEYLSENELRDIITRKKLIYKKRIHNGTK